MQPCSQGWHLGLLKGWAWSLHEQWVHHTLLSLCHCRKCASSKQKSPSLWPPGGCAATNTGQHREHLQRALLTEANTNDAIDFSKSSIRPKATGNQSSRKKTQTSIHWGVSKGHLELISDFLKDYNWAKTLLSWEIVLKLTCDHTSRCKMEANVLYITVLDISSETASDHTPLQRDPLPGAWLGR